MRKSGNTRAAFVVFLMQSFAIRLMHGVVGHYVGQNEGVPRLGIPALHMLDGPQGVGDGNTGATAFPSALTVAASFDRNNAYIFGKAMGEEQRGKGTSVLLGPMVNIMRVPVDGRSFESLGEDTCLTTKLTVPLIMGIQSQNISACVKHLALNNQEINRTLTSAVVDVRTLHEVYLPAFRAAVEDAQSGSAMCSYNMINGTYACENPVVMGWLKDGGWEGFVMSDW
jgi:beta-glucosidase